MKQSFRVLAILALAIFTLPSSVNADTTSGFTASQHSHNTGTTESPFFASVLRQDTGASFSWNAAGGLSGTAVHDDPNSATTSVVSGTLSFVGNSTFASGYTDGNGLADGLSFSYDIEFTMSGGGPGNGEFFAVAGGNSGNGLGLSNSATGPYSSIGPGQVLNFSAATISNLALSGSPTEAGVTVSNFMLDDVGFSSFRSNSFNEATSGVTLSDGTNSVGFGTSGAGIMNNNFSAKFGPVSLLNAPLTLTGDAGAAHLKGFELRSDFTYDFVSAVPEPGSACILVVAAAAGFLRRRRVS